MQTTIVRQSEGSQFAPADVSRAKTLFVAPNGNGNGNGNGNANRALVQALTSSKIYQDYERAFNEMTGLPVALQPVETWQLPHHGKRNENQFCALMSQKSHACAACLQVHDELSQRAANEPQTVTCPAGLCDTAVPVRLGDRLIGFLQTGQLLQRQPTQSQFNRAAKLATAWGLDVDHGNTEKSFLHDQSGTGQTTRIRG